MSKIPALDILKACPQHAEELGSSGLAMLLAICAQWDALGCARAVCWSNSRLAERCGLSRNSVGKVRSRLIDSGWLCYLPDGRKSGHYTPKLPEWYAQSSAVECATGVQLSVQTLCKHRAVDCAITVQMRVTYIPIPNPIPDPVPEEDLSQKTEEQQEDQEQSQQAKHNQHHVKQSLTMDQALGDMEDEPSPEPIEVHKEPAKLGLNGMDLLNVSGRFKRGRLSDRAGDAATLQAYIDMHGAEKVLEIAGKAFTEHAGPVYVSQFSDVMAKETQQSTNGSYDDMPVLA